jgi:nucleoside-diphosphate-sugar epimerase
MLGNHGWDVVVGSRSSGVRVDRNVAGELEAALGAGVDVLVDIVAFTREHGEQLNALAGRIGSVVVISSASVYADDNGLTLDEATSIDTFPRLPVPIPETQRTVAPSDETYSTQKAALEQSLLDGPLPATILRPCAIQGPGSEMPRELFFVKRVLDGRRKVVLVNNGDSRFHTTSVDNLAELIRLAAEQPGKRVLNAGDPDPPTVSEIGRAIAPELEQVPIPESGYERRELSNPWAVPFPLIVDMSRAERELGYRPVTTYANAVRETAAWLETEPPDIAGSYLERYFDYAAEDSVLG